ncbi:unnamed protein product [Calicophoron daubneyi]|uniref:Uncharacterized protein n=1 Tax=Calicophoron daubneyi TaxID=300641 RepID=A0AAV2TXT4_CALDB
MLTGREIRLPTELTLPTSVQNTLLSTDYAIRLQDDLRKAHDLARNYLQSTHRHQKEFYDQRAHGSPVRPGQCVYLHVPNPPPGVPAKLHKEWNGPFYVYEFYSDTTCRIGEANTLPFQTFTVHYNQLKLVPTSDTGCASLHCLDSLAPHVRVVDDSFHLGGRQCSGRGRIAASVDQDVTDKRVLSVSESDGDIEEGWTEQEQEPL